MMWLKQQVTRSERRWFGFSLILHLFASVCSIGAADTDEHFQILEFTAQLLQRRTEVGIAHEFFEHCRSLVQPTFYEGICRFWLLLGIDSPAFWAISIRMTSALVGWGSCVALYVWAKPKVRNPLWILQISTLLYYIPYVHARPSGESLGGSLFFLGFALFFLWGLEGRIAGALPAPLQTTRSLHLDTPRKLELRPLGIGFLFGLSFLCRFQMGFALAGLGFWFLWRRVPLQTLLKLAVGFCLALGMGVLMDYRGYGTWVFTPAVYFQISFLMGVANSTGVSPWWAYVHFMSYDVPYVGYAVAILVVIAWATELASPLTWATFAFFALHSAVGHKEARYMYPLVSALPILMTQGGECLHHLWQMSLSPGLVKKWVLRLVMLPLLILNLVGLLGATLKPSRAQVLLQNYVFSHRSEIQKVHVVGTDPFGQINLSMRFYLPPELQIIPATFQSTQEMLQLESPLWLTYSAQSLPPEAGALVQHCVLQYSVFPDWLKFFEFLPGIRNSATRASIFQCKR